MAAWADAPLDQLRPLIWADRCEELGLGAEAEFLRFLAEVWWSDEESSAVPADWPEAIGRLPPEWHSVFAIGCAWRCAQWSLKEHQKEQLEHMAELVRDLGVVPFSYEARQRADAACSQAWTTGSRADVAWPSANAAWSRANTAWSQLSAAWSRLNTASSRPAAAGFRYSVTEERWQARWLEKLYMFVGVDNLTN